MSNITIVLAADTGYAEQVHTLMKSICTHNTGVNFYLMHIILSGENGSTIPTKNSPPAAAV